MSTRDRLKAHGPAFILIAAPFVAYGLFIRRVLHPVEYPDSFAYLWRQPFNVYYLWGRSLTQRLIFTLAGNVPAVIVALQLLIYLGAALLLYLCLCDDHVPVRNAAIGALIAVLFTSYALNVSAVIVNSEPIFISLILCTPCVVALYWGPRRWTLLLAVGAAFILSKNVAPYAYIFMILAWLATLVKSKKPVDVLPHAVLIGLALVRIVLTNRYDTSVHFNMLGNAYKRIFTDAQVTAHFDERYGMPVGPFVEQCRDAWVGSDCFGRPIATVDRKTLNFALVDDEYGFADWIRQRGQRSYIRFLLLDNGLDTWKDYRFMFRWVSPRSARFMTEYLGTPTPKNTPRNLDLLKARSWGGDRGFLGFEPWAVLYAPLRLVGFGLPEVVLVYALIGFGLLSGVGYSRYLSLGVSALVSALGTYFVIIFGDAGEVVRHTYPAWLLLVLGGVFYWIGIVDLGPAIVKVARRRAQRRRFSHGGANA